MDHNILKTVGLLSLTTEAERRMMPGGDGVFPSIQNLSRIVGLVKEVILPDYFSCRRTDVEIRRFHIGVAVEQLATMLRPEIERAQRFNHRDTPDTDALTLTDRFIAQLPEIKRLLFTDVEAIYNADPAVGNYAEIILSYPVVQAMIHYRIAHALRVLGVPVIPRVITEMAHSATGIDINPGARIGEYFAIDHGTGVVIGETCIIGNHVTLYQGVTLGAKNFSLDSDGHPLNIPRHPILEDNVTVYSNSTILGRITVGHDSIIGGNVWLTHPVPPNSKIIQGQGNY